MQGLLPVLMFPVRSRPLAVAALLAAAGCSRDDAPQLATPGGSALLAALPPPVPSARRTPGAAQIATSARIRLATWNLKWLSAEDDVGPVKRKAADFQRLKGYADRLDADIIALSCLMTTTLPYQREVVEEMESLGLRERFRVMVGGGPVTKEWADEIGADGFGRDAGEAVTEARRLVATEA